MYSCIDNNKLGMLCLFYCISADRTKPKYINIVNPVLGCKQKLIFYVHKFLQQPVRFGIK